VDRSEVLVTEIDYRAQLVVVDRLDHGRDEDHADVVLPARFERVGRLPVVLGVGLRGRAVERHVEVRDSRLVEPPCEGRVESEVDPVGVELDVVDALLVHHPDDLGQLRADRRFAAGELD